MKWSRPPRLAPPLLLALLAAGPIRAAEEDAAPDAPVEEVRECIEENAPEVSLVQTVTFEAVDRMDTSTVSEAEILWKKFGEEDSRALVTFSAPPDLRGSKLLLIQDGDRTDMFMFLPDLGRVRRVTARTLHGSMFGTDFSYEDFERIQNMVDDHESKRRPDSEVDGRPVYVLEAVPGRGEESEYSRVVSYIDQETCVPLRTELFEGDELRKVVVTPRDKIRKVASGWLPVWIRMDDRVDGTHTVLTVDEIEAEKPLKDRLFSEKELQRSHTGSRTGVPNF